MRKRAVDIGMQTGAGMWGLGIERHPGGQGVRGQVRSWTAVENDGGIVQQRSGRWVCRGQVVVDRGSGLRAWRMEAVGEADGLKRRFLGSLNPEP